MNKWRHSQRCWQPHVNWFATMYPKKGGPNWDDTETLTAFKLGKYTRATRRHTYRFPKRVNHVRYGGSIFV